MNPVGNFYQGAEETEPIIYAPVFIGNECFIVASQNRRRMEQVETIGLSRLTANGLLTPLEHITNDPDLYNMVIKALKDQGMQMYYPAYLSPTNSLGELITRLLKVQNQHKSNMFSWPYEPMDTQNQYPFHYTKATSTTEISSSNAAIPTICRSCNCTILKSRSNTCTKNFCSRGCNTENVNMTALNSEEQNQNLPKKLNVFEKRAMKKNVDLI